MIFFGFAFVDCYWSTFTLLVFIWKQFSAANTEYRIACILVYVNASGSWVLANVQYIVRYVVFPFKFV